MINWIIGGLIIGFTAYISIRSFNRIRKGESTCCGDCTQGHCNSNQKCK